VKFNSVRQHAAWLLYLANKLNRKQRKPFVLHLREMSVDFTEPFSVSSHNILHELPAYNINVTIIIKYMTLII